VLATHSLKLKKGISLEYLNLKTGADKHFENLGCDKLKNIIGFKNLKLVLVAIFENGGSRRKFKTKISLKILKICKWLSGRHIGKWRMMREIHNLKNVKPILLTILKTSGSRGYSKLI
jgi:hypothetical protein